MISKCDESVIKLYYAMNKEYISYVVDDSLYDMFVGFFGASSPWRIVTL